MAIGIDIEKRGHIIGFQEEIDKASHVNEDAFFTWFDDAKNKEAAFIRGYWDFAANIALPIAKYIKEPEKKTILEIGHGGGRVLGAASRSFHKAVGVDIHLNNQKVMAELNSQGIKNIELHQANGSTIPVPQESIDVVYSFIVLQHVEKINIFHSYLKETYQALKPGGIAILYFGRKYFLSYNKSSKLLYWVDSLAEKLYLWKGYQEKEAKVNCTNLIISKSYTAKKSKELGFKVLSFVPSHKKIPDGIQIYGGQNAIILRK